MILEAVVVGLYQVNCYILASRPDSEAMIIDPGDEEAKIQRILDKHRLKPALIINTHGHIDHIGADGKFVVPVYIHCQDLDFLKNSALNLSNFLTQPYAVKNTLKAVEDKQRIKLQDLELEVIHTPGHTPGGICLLMHQPTNKILFSGDTLFFQGIGRTDFPQGQEARLIKSIKEKLWQLPDDTMVYPGHGPSTTIGKEKRNNPFLN